MIVLDCQGYTITKLAYWSIHREHSIVSTEFKFSLTWTTLTVFDWNCHSLTIRGSFDRTRLEVGLYVGLLLLLLLLLLSTFFGLERESFRYSGDLNTKLVWYSNGWKEVGCQIVWFQNATWILNSPTIWKPGKWMPSYFLMYWPFEIPTSKSLVFKCFWYSNGWYSDPQCISKRR